MIHKTIKALLLLAAVALALAACRTGETTPPGVSGVTVIAPTRGPGYPVPESGAEPSAYPAPQGDTPASEPTATAPEEIPDPPTPDASLGQVGGTLLLRTDGGTEPVANQLIYLAEILQDTQGEERAASLDRQTAPRAVTDAEGAFQFVNVPPGRYGLVLDIIIESFLLNDPDGEESLIISVETGQNIDLGALAYDELPLPPD